MKKLTFQQAAPFVALVAVAVAALFVPSLPDFADEAGAYSAADITWLLVATALVFLMTPDWLSFTAEWFIVKT